MKHVQRSTRWLKTFNRWRKSCCNQIGIDEVLAPRHPGQVLQCESRLASTVGAGDDPAGRLRADCLLPRVDCAGIHAATLTQGRHPSLRIHVGPSRKAPNPGGEIAVETHTGSRTVNTAPLMPLARGPASSVPP